ncbi:MAG: hypothetical protein ACI9FN_000508 [Saprospiraceae bacterium]|jgi:hypothetical protein
MLMKYFLYLFLIVATTISCNTKTNDSKTLPDDPCLRIDQTLIGNFRSPIMEGTMTFSGGVKGTVDISGNDYNDITCSYTIEDCMGTKMSMLCDGSAYQAEFEIYNRDSIRVDAMSYGRVK